MRKWSWAAAFICCVWPGQRAEAVPITFDLTGAQDVANTLVVTDLSGMYTLTAAGVDWSTGNLNTLFKVDRDALGMGIDSSAGLADNTDFIENAGLNERLRLDLGSNAFRLLSATVVMQTGVVSERLQVFTDGQGDPPTDPEFDDFVTPGVWIPPSVLTSSTFDFSSGAGANGGVKIASVTFDDGTAIVPEPATGLLLVTGLIPLVRRLRRTTPARARPPESAL